MVFSGSTAQRVSESLKTIQAYFVVLHIALLCFTDTAFFYRLKICGNPALSKSMSAIFPAPFAHFKSLCQSYILVILTVFHPFSLLL